MGRERWTIPGSSVVEALSMEYTFLGGGDYNAAVVYNRVLDRTKVFIRLHLKQTIPEEVRQRYKGGGRYVGFAEDFAIVSGATVRMSRHWKYQVEWGILNEDSVILLIALKGELQDFPGFYKAVARCIRNAENAESKRSKH